MADLTTNLKLTTELEAINTLLRCIGEGPVSDVDSPQNISAMNGLKTLRRVSREVQTAGWYFNSEYDVTLSKDQDGKIPVGNDVLEIDSYGSDKSTDVTRRGGFLYNLSDNTFVFAGSIKVELIRFLSFEDIPESARTYIVIKAGREFAHQEIGASDGLGGFGFNEADEARSLIILKNHEGNNADHNILTGSRGTLKVIDRTGLIGGMMQFNTIGR